MKKPNHKFQSNPDRVFSCDECGRPREEHRDLSGYAREDAARAELARRKAKQTGASRNIIAIDPGTSATGIAALINGEIAYLDVLRVVGSDAKTRLPEMCRLVSSKLDELRYWVKPDTLAMEWQMIRPGDPRPNDIANLMVVLGAALAVERAKGCQLLLPLPVQWKGSVASEVFLERVKGLAVGQAALDSMDQRGIPLRDQHNGLDAAALAVWAVNLRMPWAL